MNRAIQELEALARWVRHDVAVMENDDLRDNLARAIENRVRQLRAEVDDLYNDLLEMRPPGL